MAPEAATGKLPKPALRGLLQNSIKGALYQTTVVAIATGLAWKFFVMDPHKKAIADYNKTFDADKDFERMKKAGLFEQYTL